jgi:hypothetical protein
MLEFVLLGAAALWFVLWTRREIVEEKSLPDSSDPDLGVPEAFVTTGKPFSSPPSLKSKVGFRPAPV